MSVLQIYSRSLDGHRAEYVAVLGAEARALGIEPKNLDRITLGALRQPLLFAMLDEDLPAFFGSALLAPLLGQKVAGLFFRPGECFLPNLKHRIKGLVFKTLKALRLAEIVTILPPSIDPRFEIVSTSWVHDPQLWDTLLSSPPSQYPTSPLGREIAALANGRRIMVALGAQNRIKGFNYLCELWTAAPTTRDQYLFVAAGKVAGASRAKADAFVAAGGALIDRFITDAELHDLYGVADLVWAVYAPDYNQASGIAGRAYQKGIPVCVRSGSYIANQMIELKSPVLEIEFENLVADTATLRNAPLSRGDRPSEAMERMRTRFRDFLRRLAR